MSSKFFSGDSSLEFSEQKKHEGDEKKESNDDHFVQQPLDHDLLIQAIKNLDLETIKSYCDGLDQDQFQNLINEEEINEAIVSLKNYVPKIKNPYEFCTEQENRRHCFDIERLPGRYISWSLNPEDEIDSDEEIIGFSSDKVLVWDKIHELYKEKHYPISSCAIAIEMVALPVSVALRVAIIAATEDDLGSDPCCSPYNDIRLKLMFDRFLTKLIARTLDKKTDEIIDYLRESDLAQRQARFDQEEKGELSLSDELDQVIRENDLIKVQDFFQNHSISNEMREELNDSVAITLNEIISSRGYQSSIVNALDLSHCRGTKLEKLYLHCRSISKELAYGKHVITGRSCNGRYSRDYILIHNVDRVVGLNDGKRYIIGVGRHQDGVGILIKNEHNRLEEKVVIKKAKPYVNIKMCLLTPFYSLSNILCGCMPETQGVLNYDYIPPEISEADIDDAFHRTVHVRAMRIHDFVESKLAEEVEEEKDDSAPSQHCCTIS
ncbi:MAG: hypothetical protein ACE365_01560 [Gammaproteobacteria bacterium]